MTTRPLERAIKSSATGWLQKDKNQEALAGYLFILPTFIGFIVFVLGPIIASVGISFTGYDILSSPRFLGLENYVQLLKDPRLKVVYGNTALFTVLAVTFNISVGLLLALLLNRKLPGFLKYIFRAAYFFPVLVALAYSSVIWTFLYQKDTGIINYYLSLLGVDSIPWLSGKEWVIPSIIILDVWKNTGFAMLVFLAGLQNIPQEYVEAAQIDGAGRFAIFRNITMPLITPTLLLNLIIYMIGALQVFDSIQVLTQGGPGDASRSVTMYVTEVAFQSLQMGYGSAIAITLFIIIMILTLLQFRISRSWVFYE
jgi:multiple sugar transport system permease protein